MLKPNATHTVRNGLTICYRGLSFDVNVCDVSSERRSHDRTSESKPVGGGTKRGMGGLLYMCKIKLVK